MYKARQNVIDVIGFSVQWKAFEGGGVKVTGIVLCEQPGMPHLTPEPYSEWVGFIDSESYSENTCFKILGTILRDAGFRIVGELEISNDESGFFGQLEEI